MTQALTNLDTNSLGIWLVFITVYWISKEYYRDRSCNRFALFFFRFPFSAFDLILLIITLGVYMGVMRKFWASHEQEFSLHLLNLAIIFSAIVFAQTARTVSSRLKIFRRFHLSIIGNINGLIMNFLGSSYIYVTAFSGHELSVIISWLLIVVNILKVVRSRISDDFVITNIKTGASFSKVLSVLIFDVVARTYLSLVITFALACLLLEGPDRISSAETAVHFAISNKSDDIFVDLLYFSTISLTTVGYGDITPASVSAKLLASSFSLLGFIIFSVIIGLTLSVAMVFQKSDEPRNY